MEEELGVDLFKRSNHRIYLTEEGQQFRQRARDIVDLMERSKSELQETSQLSGILTIGCGELASMEELAVVLAHFQQTYPEVRVALHSGDNEDIRAGIDEGRFDIGLLLDPVDKGKYDFVRLKTKERWGALVHDNSPFAQYKSIKPGDLASILVLTILDRTVQQ